MQDLISVVVPVYNCGPYLDACLRSLTAQTWQNWEAILVDDGSTDDSPALCDAWAGREPRVRVLHQKNRGVSAARNAGMAAARGQYLAFVDADDWVEPEFLQELCWAVQGADVSLCVVDTGENSANVLRKEVVSVRKMRQMPSVYTDLHYMNYSVNKVYRMELLRRDALLFPQDMKRSEDAFFVAKYYELCNRVSVVPKAMYHYRTNPNSATHTFYTGVCRDEAILMKMQYDFFHQYPLTQEEENAFHKWEYGKILGILRYIVHYAPKTERRKYVEQFLSVEQVIKTFGNPPSETGKKALLAAYLSKLKKSGTLTLLLEHM